VSANRLSIYELDGRFHESAISLKFHTIVLVSRPCDKKSFPEDSTTTLSRYVSFNLSFILIPKSISTLSCGHWSYSRSQLERVTSRRSTTAFMLVQLENLTRLVLTLIDCLLITILDIVLESDFSQVMFASQSWQYMKVDNIQIYS
jgi:hypothetical protein